MWKLRGGMFQGGYMKTGDLVKFRNCLWQDTDMTGIITRCTEPSHVAKNNPVLRLYWVLVDTSVECFTGNQLVLI